MKKKFQSLIVLIFFFMVSCSIVSAEIPLSLFSKAGLKADCLKNVTGASIWIGGSGVANNSDNTNSQWFKKSETDFDCLELMNSIYYQELSFSVARPKDMISVYVGLYDKDGNQLFSGSKSGYLEFVDGAYRIPEDLTYLYVEMCAIISIPLSDSESAKYARVMVRDENGQIMTGESLPIYDGMLSFPTQYAGCDGELVISYYSNGHYWEEWYDLKTMELLPQEVVSARVWTQVDEYYNFGLDPWCISFWIYSQADETYSNPLLKFEVGNEKCVPMSACLRDVNGVLIEMAYAVAYRKMGDSDWSTQEIGPENEILNLPEEGVYQAFFLFKKQESNPIPVNFYGGKG